MPKKKEENNNPILCIDFDGVLHSYVSGWQGIDEIPDPPVAGAIEWLEGLIQQSVKAGNLRPMIYSSRSKSLVGVEAMRDWLELHGLSPLALNVLEFPKQKPPAFLTIDDRCFCFTGVFPTSEQMLAFEPWHRD